jgi:hypothetical protein
MSEEDATKVPPWAWIVIAVVIILLAGSVGGSACDPWEEEFEVYEEPSLSNPAGQTHTQCVPKGED